jgi:hypothetical protein
VSRQIAFGDVIRSAGTEDEEPPVRPAYKHRQ